VAFGEGVEGEVGAEAVGGEVDEGADAGGGAASFAVEEVDREGLGFVVFED
jgi:hypothetical protein